MISESIITHRLRQCLVSCLNSSEQAGLEVVSASLNDVLGKLDSPMQLAIIGKVSSSKSTLVNAILGKAGIVGTGQMEKTYNVSWLKYGPSDSDVKVFLKDGTCRMISRSEWEALDDGCISELKDNVKYFEVTYDHEILKSINIIDTPGLDSVKGTDSRNTIEFLRDVRPDAVIMLFTRGLAESTMSVVREFQGAERNPFALSPLNAVGLLSKTDYLWSVKEKGMSPNLKARRDVIDGNIYRLFPDVKNTLFAILPICSMLALASRTIEDNDVAAFQQLAAIGEDTLRGMLSSADDFLDDYYCSGLSLDELNRLYAKFGLYGVYEGVKLAQTGTLNREAFASLFKDVSGFWDFEDCLYSHFGQRSFLIKTQSAGAQINSACIRQRPLCGNDAQQLNVLDSIQNSVLSCLMTIFEYKQLDFLTRIYNQEMRITDQQALDEYKVVCGESGASVVQKLGMTGEHTVAEMIDAADKRAGEYNVEYLCSSHTAPDDAALYRMLSDSYAMLAGDIRAVSEKMAEAEKTIVMSNSFLYGK